MSNSILVSLILLGSVPALTAADLSKYRDFQLGSSLPNIAKQAGANPSDAKSIHSRPALIQELEWHPRPLGQASRTEAVESVVFSFQNGSLFQIAVLYDRYETEGLTADDFVETISATYGSAVRPAPKVVAEADRYAEREDVLARWEDPQYRMDLVRAPYGPGFRLMVIAKGLNEQAHAATLEAKRLDEQEAPQRDAARLVTEQESARAKLEKARLLNKPKFRL